MGRIRKEKLRIGRLLQMLLEIPPSILYGLAFLSPLLLPVSLPGWNVQSAPQQPQQSVENNSKQGHSNNRCQSPLETHIGIRLQNSS